MGARRQVRKTFGRLKQPLCRASPQAVVRLGWASTWPASSAARSRRSCRREPRRLPAGRRDGEPRRIPKTHRQYVCAQCSLSYRECEAAHGTAVLNLVHAPCACLMPLKLVTPSAAQLSAVQPRTARIRALVRRRNSSQQQDRLIIKKFLWVTNSGPYVLFW
jgi:hypothetical protein